MQDKLQQAEETERARVKKTYKKLFQCDNGMGLVANRRTTQFAYWKDGKTKQRLSRRIESTAEL